MLFVVVAVAIICSTLSLYRSNQLRSHGTTLSAEAGVLLFLLLQAAVDKWLDVAAALENSAASWVQPTCQQASDEVSSRDCATAGQC
jgi:hypothetical protein